MVKRDRDTAESNPSGKRRKNDQDSNTATADPVQQQANVTAYMFHALKLLQKSLKKSKTIEVQKLARKLKLAQEPKDGAAIDSAMISDLSTQLSTLKDLPIDPLALSLLSTRVAKIASIQSYHSTLLASLPPSTPMEELASTSVEGKNRNRLLANKLVKESWSEISRAVAKRMGEVVEERVVIVKKVVVISAKKIEEMVQKIEEEEGPVKRMSKRALRTAKGVANAIKDPQTRQVALARLERAVPPPKAPVVRFKPEEESEQEDEEEREMFEDEDENEDDLEGEGSEEDDEDEVMKEMARLDAGIGSGSESGFDSDSDKGDDSDNDSTSSFPAAAKAPKSTSAPAPTKSIVKPAKKLAVQQSKPKKPITSSAFLPSLASGYISYSDSDDEDAQWVKDEEKNDKKKRKNRRGQRARQAIWEQKYGSGANHIVKDTGAPAAAVKGSKANKNDTSKSKPKKSILNEGVPGKGDRYAAFDGSTTRPGAEFNPNTQPIMPRTASKVEKGMHPSWEAKRKQAEADKERMENAPKGKKIVFD